MHSQIDKCVYYLHTLFCLTCLWLSPPPVPSFFYFTGRTQGREEKESLREGWLFASKKSWKEADVTGTFLSCHASVLLPHNHRLLSTWACSSYLGHLFFWCGPGTAQSTVRHWGGSAATPIFPIQQFTSRGDNIAERLRAARLREHSRLQPGRRTDDGGWIISAFLLWSCGQVEKSPM